MFATSDLYIAFLLMYTLYNSMTTVNSLFATSKASSEFHHHRWFCLLAMEILVLISMWSGKILNSHEKICVLKVVTGVPL